MIECTPLYNWYWSRDIQFVAQDDELLASFIPAWESPEMMLLQDQDKGV